WDTAPHHTDALLVSLSYRGRRIGAELVPLSWRKVVLRASWLFAGFRSCWERRRDGERTHCRDHCREKTSVRPLTSTMVVGAYVRIHNTAVVVLLLALICCASCLQQPAAVEETSRRQRPQQQQQQQGNQGNSQAGDQAIYHGGVTDVAGNRDGARFRRRLLSKSTATPPNAGANEQHQQLDTAGEQEAWEEQARAATTTTTVAARRANPGMHGSEEGARAAVEGVLEGGVARAAQVQTMDVLEAESGGAVEAAVGEGAEEEQEQEQEQEQEEEQEEDKGIEEGEAGGFVVVAPDSEPEQRGQGENIDNDNASTNGISNNVMVIVFCALAFVANGGFLVYVFWVM
ncbi:unnamed protein product, partial [Ectocarpus sp. 12 AP-2014]